MKNKKLSKSLFRNRYSVEEFADGQLESNLLSNSCLGSRILIAHLTFCMVSNFLSANRHSDSKQILDG